MADRSLEEPVAVGQDRLLGALAAHGPAQPLGLAGAEARQRHRDLDHLLLEDDRAQGVGEDRLERGVRVGDLGSRGRARSASLCRR